ncbi:LVIVD repeat-containing protein [Paludibaculum fermentans]|uniref:LVIVD repeat-containing protein n=1 Tax=Paludibaculum fermentans TaxID=1473598 RepID=UPI003EB77876
MFNRNRPGVSLTAAAVLTAMVWAGPASGAARITSTIPAVGHPGEEVQFQVDGTTRWVGTAWFTAADGSRIRSMGQSGNPIVPHGAVSGPVWVELNAETLTEAYDLTVLPRLRLHAERQRVSGGETIQIAAKTPSIPGDWALTWRADLGTVDGTGRFHAPMVASTQYARIWACLRGGTECGTTVVAVSPIRLEPERLVLTPGKETALRVVQGGNEVSAAWRAVTANVSITSDGRVTAGTGPLDGGVAVVEATAAGATQEFRLPVRTAGVVANTLEWSDWIAPDSNNPNNRLALGSHAESVATHGDWLYVLQSSILSYLGPSSTTWIDVYWLDEDRNPIWVDCVDAPRAYSGGLWVVGDTLYVAGSEQPTTTMQYDISGGRAVLRSRGRVDGPVNASPPGGVQVTAQRYYSSATANQWNVVIQNQAEGWKRTLPLEYQPLTDAPIGVQAAGTSTWVAITFGYSLGYETLVADVTGDRAVPFALLASGGINHSLTVLGDVLVVGGDIYRVSGGKVAKLAEIPWHFVLDADPSTMRLLMGPDVFLQEDGFRVVDLSNPEHPRSSAPVAHPKSWAEGRLGSDYFVLVGPPQGVSVIPIDWTSGMRKTDAFPASPWTNALRYRDGYLFWTGPGWGYRGRSWTYNLLEVNDMTGPQARLVATADRPGDQVGWALQLVGPYAYVGTDTELIVYDVSVPTAPVERYVVPAPAISMAVQGHYLYAGSQDGPRKTLVVYDISAPERPQRVGTVALKDWAYGLAAGPGWLWVALGQNGYEVYSTVNPAAPSPLFETHTTAWDAAAVGNLAYVAADGAGLQILDMTNPSAPRLLSETSLAAGFEAHLQDYPNALSVTLDERGVAWLATSREGRVVGVDVRRPEAPRPIAVANTSQGYTILEAMAAVAVDNRLIIAGNDAAFDVARPQNLGLYQVPQTQPGEVLPDRFGDLPPVTQSMRPGPLPWKARYLNGDQRLRETETTGARPFRAERPASTPTRR